MKELSSITTKAKKFDQGQFINQALNNNVSNFIPDIMAENITKNYSNAKQIYGQKITRYLTGYSDQYLKRNLKIPEFTKEVKKRIKEKIDDLKKDKIIDRKYNLTKYGKEIGVVTGLFIQLKKLDELFQENLMGKFEHKFKTKLYGAEKQNVRNYKKGDSYKNMAIKSSIKIALRRNHKKIDNNDIKIFDKKNKANATIIYGIDSSSSMKGRKLEAARNAGISLAYKTIYDKNKLGLIDFSDKINKSLVTHDFNDALNFIYDVKINAQTDLSKAILHSISLFPEDSDVKHLILLSDIVATKAEHDEESPEEATLNAAAIAKANNISVSLIIIDEDKSRDKQIMTFASRIIEVSNGKIYKIDNLNNLDKLVIKDYESII